MSQMKREERNEIREVSEFREIKKICYNTVVEKGFWIPHVFWNIAFSPSALI